MNQRWQISIGMTARKGCEHALRIYAHNQICRFFLLGLKVFFGNRYNGKTVATKVRHTVLNLSYLKARGLSFKVRQVMHKYSTKYVGMDVHKETIAVAIAQGGRSERI